MDYREIKHFTRFNAFRFIAASLVVIHHAESLRADAGLFHLKEFGLSRCGSLAVTFFFVLSGFLITYLLLKEDRRTGKTQIKHFYLKRVYRIWPLYFLMVFVGVCLQPFLIQMLGLPYQLPYTWGETWAYFLFFFPGLVTFFHGSHLLQPLWSIGVEEVFYLIWAPLFRWCRKYLLAMFLAVIVLKIALIHLAAHGHFPPVVEYLIRILQFQSMAAGAIAAYLLFHHGETIKIRLKHPRILQWILSIVTVLLLLDPFTEISWWVELRAHGRYLSTFESVLFAMLLFSFALTNAESRVLDSKIGNFLGDISYGIYMYHLMVVTILMEGMKAIHLNDIVGTIVFYLLSFGITILLAGISKRYFENYFLRYRARLN